MTADLKKRADESELNYIWRLGKLRDDGVIDMTWSELAEILNSQLREPDEEYTESAYRKKYKTIKDAYDEIFSSYKEDNYIQELTLQRQELQKEQRKLRDERLDLNKRLREQARLESTIEKLGDSLSEIANTYFPETEYPSPIPQGHKMIICLSDLHIGQTFNTVDGKYNSHIAAERLMEYLGEITIIAQKNDCSECYVCLLGDLISGSIHHRISVTNKEDVIEQVKTASILVSEFVGNLSSLFSSVSVYSVGGNHSRLEKNAEDALLSERLDELIPWFVSEAMKNKKNVTVYGKTFDETLGLFNVGNKTYFIQHGDYTRINDTEIGKLVLWAKKTPYCILTGHMHYPAMTDISGIKVVQSGSLCGSGDEYTRSKRWTGAPSQTVLVTKQDGSIYGVFPVELNSGLIGKEKEKIKYEEE